MTRTALLLGLLLCGCQRVAPPLPDGGSEDAGACGLGCEGCCGATDDRCAAGFSQARCGRQGSTCVDCGAGSCVNGRCEASDGGCFAPPVPGASWANGWCPDAGCPAGNLCLRGVGESGSVFGCLPISGRCDGGVASCACMGCVCGIACVDTADGFACDNGTISTRELKRDIHYLSSAEREQLANQALAIPLATYQYTFEPAGQGRRLGFIIEDQPVPSAAVRPDRRHVDEYGYTSLLLATIQAQARQLAELQARVERLERRRNQAASRQVE